MRIFKLQFSSTSRGGRLRRRLRDRSPAPAAEWLATGGHHTLEPMVALSFAAAATTTVRVHTNLYVAAYRSPLLAAKSLASLDVLSGGRLVVGLGAGYLEGEFAALGVDFATRNQALDDAIALIKLAWTGEPVHGPGASPDAEEVVVQPRPLQDPHPPLWIGGNSKAAIRRGADGRRLVALRQPQLRVAHGHRRDRVGRRPGPPARPAPRPGRGGGAHRSARRVLHPGPPRHPWAALRGRGAARRTGPTVGPRRHLGHGPVPGATRAEWLDQVTRFATDVVGPATAGG